MGCACNTYLSQPKVNFVLRHTAFKGMLEFNKEALKCLNMLFGSACILGIIVTRFTDMSNVIRNRYLGFRPGQTQTGIYGHRQRWLEVGKICDCIMDEATGV